MIQKKLAELTDEELLDEAKKIKSTNITNAVLIGFLMGIVFYSIVKNSWGFVTLIPLYFVYKLFNKSNHNKKELENVLRERNLNE
jgi:type IV secretory pathway VirB3-like protein